MSNYILTADGKLYHCDTSESELYHYGVPGMKWGQRKLRRLQGKERKLNKRLAKEEKRYQKVANKNNKAVAKGDSGRKLDNLANKEMYARAKKNTIKAKRVKVSLGTKAAKKVLNLYADCRN